MSSRILKLLILCLFITVNTWAQELTQDLSDAEDNTLKQSDVVVLEKQEDTDLSYKKRRTKHGALFSLTTEKFYPIDYISLFQDAFIEDIVRDNSFDLVGFELGYKHNISIMSFSVLFGYARGSISGSTTGGKRDISINKQGLSVNAALDGVLEEPWVVPYGQIGIHHFNVSETDATGTGATLVSENLSATTGISFNFKYGLLFQIDWIENLIDKVAKAERIKASGLENTYIDLYFSHHLASSDAADPSSLLSEGDPNLQSSAELGFGIKLEF